MSRRSTRTQIDDQRKDHIDLKWTAQRNRPKQLQSHNVPTYDEENTNGTNKGIYLFPVNKPQIVLWGTERKLQRNQKQKGATLHWSTHPQLEQDEMAKKLALVKIDNK